MRVLGGDYEFTNEWFNRHAGVWKQLLGRFQPRRILEIGSYEGRSACFVVETCAADRDIELHCVDSWAGGVEHDRTAMPVVEQRFDRNLEIARSRVGGKVDLHKHKSLSAAALVALLAAGQGQSFDLIYVDGSHQAPDVLSDAVLAFMLLKVGGVLIFDDYLWAEDHKHPRDPIECPKIAIDAFLNINIRKLRIITAPVAQIYAQKISD